MLYSNKPACHLCDGMREMTHKWADGPLAPRLPWARDPGQERVPRRPSRTDAVQALGRQYKKSSPPAGTHSAGGASKAGIHKEARERGSKSRQRRRRGRQTTTVLGQTSHRWDTRGNCLIFASREKRLPVREAGLCGAGAAARRAGARPGAERRAVVKRDCGPHRTPARARFLAPHRV